MRWMTWLGLLGLLAACGARAESARIVKVLPFYLDQKGRQSLEPNLIERDTYQASLRAYPARRSALRFDVQWKARGLKDLTLKIEARGSQGGEPRQATLETPARKSFLENWTSLILEGEAYKKLGELTAWRATLWSGGQVVAEQRSFLWDAQIAPATKSPTSVVP